MLDPKVLTEKLVYCTEHYSCAGCPGPKCPPSSTRPRVEYIMRQAVEAICTMHEKLGKIVPAMAETVVDDAMSVSIPPDVLHETAERRLAEQTVEMILKHPDFYTFSDSLDIKRNERHFRFTILIMPPGGERDA